MFVWMRAARSFPHALLRAPRFYSIEKELFWDNGNKPMHTPVDKVWSNIEMRRNSERS